jgi:hypothetical protein
MNPRNYKIGLFSQLIFVFYAANSIAIERFSSAGAREAALSLSAVALPGTFSVFHNQALLADLKSVSIGISHRKPYFIPGYNESAISVVIPVPAAVLAIGITQSSLASYHESGFGISIAKKLSGSLSAGLLFNGFFISFPEVGSFKGSFQLDGGLKYSCSEKLMLGFHVKNIIHTKTETFQYNLSFPFTVRGGACYELSEKILLTAEAIRDEWRAVAFRCGSELTLLDKFKLRGGIATLPFQHSLGFGYALRSCNIDFALVHHELLGYSPLLSLNLRIN